MSSKTQPEEHEVLSEIEKVLAQNPEFGVKRVSVVVKEQNPEWSLSEKRVTKLLKKHKSIKITLDDGDSDSTSDDSPKAAAPSPWNVAPTAAPAAHDPWNSTVVVETTTSAFNSVTEAAAKVVAPVVSAFNVEPVAEPVPAAAAYNPWNTAPVHDKTFTETVKEHATAAVEQVKETTSNVIAATPGFVEKAKDAVVDAAEKVHDKAEDVVDDIKDDAPGFFEKIKDAAEDAVESVKDTASDVAEKVKDTASDAVDAVKEATSSAPSPWNAAPVETVAFVVEPAKEIVVPVAAPVVVEEPKKEAWNFTPVKEEAAKVAESLEESAKSTIEKVKEEAAAAVVVIKKAESAVEDKLVEAKIAAENLVGAGYESASVAPKKDASKRPSTEKDVEGGACGACGTSFCSIM
jgi:ElaB/YqjD/DUF883 family membrane-anchored ribosome-binding protein